MKYVKNHALLGIFFVVFSLTVNAEETWELSQFDTKLVSDKPVVNRITRSLSVYARMKNDENFDLSGQYRFVLTDHSIPLAPDFGGADGVTDNGKPYFLVNNGEHFNIAESEFSSHFVINLQLSRGSVFINGYFEKFKVAGSLEDFKTNESVLSKSTTFEIVSGVSEDNELFEMNSVKGIIEVFLSDEITDDEYQNIISFIKNSYGEVQGFSSDLGLIQAVFENYQNSELHKQLSNLPGVIEVDYLYALQDLAEYQGYISDDWNSFTSDDWIHHHSFGSVWDSWILSDDKRDINAAVLEQHNTRTFVGLEGRHTQYNFITTTTNKPHANNVTSVGFSRPILGNDGRNKNPFGAYWGGEVFTAVATNVSDMAQIAIELFRDHNVKVINISQHIEGWGSFAYRQRIFRRKFKKAILEASKQQALIVFAAGNEDVIHNHVFSTLEDSFEYKRYKKYLDAWDNAALNVGGVIAPGYQLLDTTGDGSYDELSCITPVPIDRNALVPDESSGTGEVVNIYARSITHRIDSTDKDLGCIYGTSFAAPLVAGASALLLSLSDELTGKEVKDALIKNAYSFSKTYYDVHYGFLNVEGAFWELGLGSSTFDFNDIWRAGTVTTTEYNDLVNVSGIILESTLVTLGGDDTITIGEKMLRSRLYAGEGNNTITMPHAHDSTITSGAGKDVIYLNSQTRLDLHTGSNGDKVTINGQLYEGRINLEDGNDVMYINSRNFVRAFVDMGQGIDVLIFSRPFSDFNLVDENDEMHTYKFGTYNSTLRVNNVEAIIFSDGTILGSEAVAEPYL